MQKKLFDIAQARFGVNAKGLKEGPMALVQSSALQPDGTVELAYVDRVYPELLNYKPEDILRKNDVLLIGKGAINSAAIWTGSNEDTIASAMLFVIRPDTTTVLPEYLTAYLNSRPAEAQMTRFANTGSVNVLSRKALDQLQIPVPPIDEQLKLVHLAKTVQRTKHYLHTLSSSYTQLLDAVWENYSTEV